MRNVRRQCLSNERKVEWLWMKSLSILICAVRVREWIKPIENNELATVTDASAQRTCSPTSSGWHFYAINHSIAWLLLHLQWYFFRQSSVFSGEITNTVKAVVCRSGYGLMMIYGRRYDCQEPFWEEAFNEGFWTELKHKNNLTWSLYQNRLKLIPYKCELDTSVSTLAGCHLFLASFPPRLTKTLFTVHWNCTIRAKQQNKEHKHNLLGRGKLCFQRIKVWLRVASLSPMQVSHVALVATCWLRFLQTHTYIMCAVHASTRSFTILQTDSLSAWSTLKHTLSAHVIVSHREGFIIKRHNLQNKQKRDSGDSCKHLSAP